MALAEKLGIPVATSLNGKDSIRGDHPLNAGVVGSYCRESANRLVGEASLVCFVGTETGGMTTHFWAVPKIGTPAVQIDIAAEALGRDYSARGGGAGRCEGDARAHGANWPMRKPLRGARHGAPARARCAKSGSRDIARC